MEKQAGILITGAKGFIGKNLVSVLRTAGEGPLLACEAGDDPALLEEQAAACRFVYHLAGVNRPQSEAEYAQGNVDFTARLLGLLRRRPDPPPLLFTSSAQAAQQNPYGQSKRRAEELILGYGVETGAKVLIYRLPNVFGKWCRPGYNSAVATFCHRLARGEPPEIQDPAAALNLIYIDDVVDEFVRVLRNLPDVPGGYHSARPVYPTTVGALARTLGSFDQARRALSPPDLSDGLTKKLYAVYLSHLPGDALRQPLTSHPDHRGSFTELVRTRDRGQVSVSVCAPGVTRGGHWHRTKCERFFPALGRGVIRLQDVAGGEPASIEISSDRPAWLDIPPGCAHSIYNPGPGPLVTVIWASEPYDPDHPDTYETEV